MRLRLFGLAATAALLAGCGAAASSPPPPSAVSASQPAASTRPPAPSKPVAASAPAPAIVQTKILVGYSSLTAAHLPIWMAYEAGIFAKNGLDVQLVSLQSSANTAALISGQVQFVEGGGSEALSAAAGGAGVLVLFNPTPVYDFVMEAVPSIKTAAELKGAKIGISGIGTTSDIATRLALSKIGLDPDKDVSIVAVGSAQDRRAALLNGALQAGLAQPPDVYRLEASGLHPVYDMSSSGAPTAASIGEVLKSYVAAHHDVVQKYVDSEVEGLGRAKADKTMSVQVLKKWLQNDNEDDLGKSWDYYTQHIFPPAPFARPEQFADAKQVLAKDNDKVANFDMSTAIDTAFVQSAVDRGLTKS
jgi:NitT/TauT family transport system substrate-binding protein